MRIKSIVLPYHQNVRSGEIDESTIKDNEPWALPVVQKGRVMMVLFILANKGVLFQNLWSVKIESTRQTTDRAGPIPFVPPGAFAPPNSAFSVH